MRRKATHTIYKSESPLKSVSETSQADRKGMVVQFENEDVAFININKYPKKRRGLVGNSN